MEKQAVVSTNTHIACDLCRRLYERGSAFCPHCGFGS